MNSWTPHTTRPALANAHYSNGGNNLPLWEAEEDHAVQGPAAG